MARHHYLFVMWDGGGAVPPQLAVAQQLAAHGHQVSVLGEDSMQAEIEAADCRFVPYRFAPNRPDRQPGSDPFPDWDGQSPFAVLHNLMCAHAAEYAKDVAGSCRGEEVSKVVVDSFLLGGMIGAEAAGKNYTVLCPAIDIVPHPGRPPDGLGLKPGANPLMSARNQLLNFVFRKMMQSGRKVLNEVRASYHLAPVQHPFDQYEKAEKVLLLTSRHFDYPVQLPANTLYAGPQLADPSWAGKSPGEFPEPFVLVSLGSTFQNQKPLYLKLIEVLRRLPLQAVVTLGAVFEPNDFPAYPNVTILRSAAHEELLPKCGLVINHGGHGIVMKSILAGLPQLVIPLRRDQPGNAARVVHHGLGLQAKPKEAIPSLLQKAKILLAEDCYSNNAAAMSRKIREEMAAGVIWEHLI